jgi:hypothetical protein
MGINKNGFSFWGRFKILLKKFMGLGVICYILSDNNLALWYTIKILISNSDSIL